MIPKSEFERIRFIRGRDYGTGFFVDVDGRQFFVTAAHLVDPASGTIDMMINGQLRPFAVSTCQIGRDDVDITLLTLEHRQDMGEALPLAPTSAIWVGSHTQCSGNVATVKPISLFVDRDALRILLIEDGLSLLRPHEGADEAVSRSHQSKY